MGSRVGRAVIVFVAVLAVGCAGGPDPTSAGGASDADEAETASDGDTPEAASGDDAAVVPGEADGQQVAVEADDGACERDEPPLPGFERFETTQFRFHLPTGWGEYSSFEGSEDLFWGPKDEDGPLAEDHSDYRLGNWTVGDADARVDLLTVFRIDPAHGDAVVTDLDPGQFCIDAERDEVVHLSFTLHGDDPGAVPYEAIAVKRWFHRLTRWDVFGMSSTPPPGQPVDKGVAGFFDTVQSVMPKGPDPALRDVPLVVTDEGFPSRLGPFTLVTNEDIDTHIEAVRARTGSSDEVQNIFAMLSLTGSGFDLDDLAVGTDWYQWARDVQIDKDPEAANREPVRIYLGPIDDFRAGHNDVLPLQLSGPRAPRPDGLTYRDMAPDGHVFGDRVTCQNGRRDIHCEAATPSGDWSLSSDRYDDEFFVARYEGLLEPVGEDLAAFADVAR